MPSISFYGPVFLADGKSDDDGMLNEITDTKTLKEYNGFSYDGEDNLFSTWIPDHDDPLLNEVEISNGLMSFEYSEESQSLIGKINYKINRLLNKEEIEALTEYTIGQLLDGIGSNFQQERFLERLDCPIINYEELKIDQGS